MMAWDPFDALWLPHDPHLTGWRVLRAYVRRMNQMYRVVTDPARWQAEAVRLRRAAWTLRTPGRRRQVLGDLILQRSVAGLGFDPRRAALAEALLTPLTGVTDFEQALDRRALEREAAAMRLERLAAGERPWPPAT
jgi:hypothetical protein